MILKELFSDSLLIILTYYLGMIMWISVIYMFRDTFKLLRNIILEYKYDSSSEKKINPNVLNMYNKMVKNIYIMMLINFIASIFCSLYLIILGVKLFIIITIPLIVLLISLLILMGMFSNMTTKDVHRTKTILG